MSVASVTLDIVGQPYCTDIPNIGNSTAPSKMAPRIEVIGSLNLDLVSTTSRVPQGGETIITQSFTTGCGGKGANQAVACARLSRSQHDLSNGSVIVSMAGAVGDDSFGGDLLKGLRDNGVDAASVWVRKGEKSGVAVIIVEEDSGENRILMSPGANFSLKLADFTNLPAPLPDIIILQLEIPLDTTLQILKTAQQNNIEVLLNPAPAQKLPNEAYLAVTHLVVNESEASIVTGNEARDIDWRSDAAQHKTLLDLGARHVIITLGARGVCYLSKGKPIQTFAAQKVNVKDTTAAGDTFVGAYAVAIMLNRDRSETAMAKAIDWANQAAAKTVERPGAQSAIPWANELLPFSAR